MTTDTSSSPAAVLAPSLVCPWPGSDGAAWHTAITTIERRLAHASDRLGPHQQLMAAILADAVEAIRTAASNPSLLDGVWSWLETPGDDPFSFEQACRALELDVAALRELLRVRPRPEGRATMNSTLLNDVQILNTIRDDMVAEHSAALVGADTEAGRELARRIGERVARHRAARGWDLETLAERSNLTRDALERIEAGDGLPGLRLIWQLASALRVSFGTLFEPAPTPDDCHFRVHRADATRLVGSPGGLRSRAVPAPPPGHRTELYDLTLPAGMVEVAEPHAPDTYEQLVVTAGRVRIVAGSRVAVLDAGDTLTFRADVAHRYENPTAAEARAVLAMHYA